MKLRMGTVQGLIVLLVLAAVPPVLAQAPGSERSDWWNVPYPGVFDGSKVPAMPGWIRVEGNRFVDAQGKPVILRGVNISDPDKLEKGGHWSKKHFEVIKAWGANVIRVPVHPVAWKLRGSDEYFKLLDQAVVWASELGIYLIVEWHSMGNLEMGLLQHPMHETTKQGTFEFWRAIAHRYAGVSTIAFYEIFNEPTLFNGTLGAMSWGEWKRINEQVIGVIRANGAKAVPLVAGLDWAYELRSVGKEPVDAPGIGYITHPYPMKAQQPWEGNWEKDFGYVADRFPVFATEIGFMAATDPGAHVPVMSDEEYGRRIVAYFDKKHISWTVWCFDPDWPPQMISDWVYTPTRQGAFFRAVMLKK